MKVLMLNGSRNESGCTFTALSEVAKALKAEGIDSEIVWCGKDSLNGNLDNLVKDLAQKVKACDGLVVGSPVYYASPSAEIQAVLDRLCGVAAADLRLKPAAAVISARRAGTTAALDVLNKYFAFSEMPVVSSRYWNMVHGSKPDDVMQDAEGLQIMQVLGSNMAWMLKCIEAGKNAGIKAPEAPVKTFTNFIRK